MDVSSLSQLLAARDWRAADVETARLLLADGDEGGFSGLESHEILTLHCELLRAIDDAWTAASDGHFGFAAQLDVLRSVREDGLSRSSSWRVFSRRAGWITDDGWVERDGLHYDLDAPKGHLPWFPATFPTVATGRISDVLLRFYDHVAYCTDDTAE